MQVETKEADVSENPADDTGVNDGDKEDKIKEQVELPSAKMETPNSGISKGSSTHPTPSIQEPLLKAELKEEETIHDSDFEEPSGRLKKVLQFIPQINKLNVPPIQG